MHMKKKTNQKTQKYQTKNGIKSKVENPHLNPMIYNILYF